MNSSTQIKMDINELLDKREYYAELTYWDGHKETVKIRRKFIQDIVFAVKGQYTFCDNESGLCVYGGSIYNVNIYTK